MNSTVGRYKTSSWTFIPNTRLITVYNILDATDISALNVVAIQRTAIPAPIIGTASSGGSVTTGVHYYAVTMVTPYGESFLGIPSSSITVSGGNQTVPITGIPTGNVNVTSRNLYRTNAGAASTGTYYLITTISDNVTTTFTDTTADNTTTPSPYGVPTSTGAFGLQAPSLVNCQCLGYSSPLTTPTAGTATSGGSLGVGAYYYAVTFIIGGSETIPSPISNTITTTSGNKTIPLTNIPLGPYGTIARNIYRTNVGGSTLYLLNGTANTIADNTTTTLTDNYADSTTTLPPTTSTAYNIIYNSIEPVLNSTDIPYIKLDVIDNVRDENFGIYRTLNQAMSELPPPDPQVAPYTDTNIAASATYYEVPASGWRNFMAELICTVTTTNATLSVWATLDNTIAASASPVTGWVNITGALYGTNTPTSSTYATGTLTMTAGNTVQDIRNWAVDVNGKPAMYNRFCIVYTPGSTTNFIQINIIQF
jgi:hypothetical protein